MKKSKYVFILLLAIVFLPVIVSALDGRIMVSCDDTVISPGGTLNCSISGNSFSAPVSSFHAIISLGEGLSLVSAENDSSWLGEATDGIIDLFTDVNKTGDVNFASFVIKADDNASGTLVVSVEDIIISDNDFKGFIFGVVTTQIEVSTDGSGSGGNEGGEEPEVPDEFIFNIGSDYEVLDGIIANIDVGTTIDNIDIEANHNLVFYNIIGEVVESGVLMTGYKVTDGNVEYTLVVKGDINGDGYANSDDSKLVSKHILDINKLDGLFALAANIDFNNSIDINDVIKLVEYINEINS